MNTNEGKRIKITALTVTQGMLWFVMLILTVSAVGILIVGQGFFNFVAAGVLMLMCSALVSQIPLLRELSQAPEAINTDDVESREISEDEALLENIHRAQELTAQE